MKGRYHLSKHAPDVQEGDVGDVVQVVDGGDAVEVRVLLVIAFGARLVDVRLGLSSFSFFQVGTVTEFGGRRGLVGYR